MPTDIIQFEPDEREKEIIKSLGYSEAYNFEKIKGKFKIVEGKDDETNRKAVESKNTKILLNPHATRSKDFMHSRNSGLNHILCKLAAENGIAIGFSLDRMYEPDDLGRVKQDIKLCRKAKCKIVVFSFAKNIYEMRAVYDILSFLRVLGMDSGSAKKALEFRANIEQNPYKSQSN